MSSAASVAASAAATTAARAATCRPRATATSASSSSSSSSSSNPSRSRRIRAPPPRASRSPSAYFVDVTDADPGVKLAPFEPGMRDATVFGVSHMTNAHEAAEHILVNAPASVVVETGLCKEHGAARGTTFKFDEIFTAIEIGGAKATAEESLQFITRVAHQLRLEERPLHKSPFWQSMKTQARSIHWFPYDRVGVVNADP
jgi:hypothetical protein